MTKKAANWTIVMKTAPVLWGMYCRTIMFRQKKIAKKYSPTYISYILFK